MNTSTWIKISDRKPTEADLPIIMGAWANDRSGRWISTLAWQNLICPGNWTHWYPMNKIPELPFRTPTQEELDNALTEEALKAYQRDGFLSGIRFERQFYRDLVARYTANDISIQETMRLVKERVT